MPQSTSAVNNPIGHSGLFLLAGDHLYHNLARAYDARLGRFLQRDPIGYADGMNTYQGLGSMPHVAVAEDGTVSTRVDGPFGPTWDAGKKQCLIKFQMTHEIVWYDYVIGVFTIPDKMTEEKVFVLILPECLCSPVAIEKKLKSIRMSGDAGDRLMLEAAYH